MEGDIVMRKEIRGIWVRTFILLVGLVLLGGSSFSVNACAAPMTLSDKITMESLNAQVNGICRSSGRPECFSENLKFQKTMETGTALYSSVGNGSGIAYECVDQDNHRVLKVKVLSVDDDIAQDFAILVMFISGEVNATTPQIAKHNMELMRNYLRTSGRARLSTNGRSYVITAQKGNVTEPGKIKLYEYIVQAESL